MIRQQWSVLALIPARGGSKGIPEKNLQKVGGLPLIAHAIDCARAAGIRRVVVSTDSAAIARVARRHGAEVPWLRPARIAGSHAAIIDAVLHALDRLEADEAFVPSAVVLLQPTSPFRRAATVRKGLSLHRRSGGASVVSVSPAAQHPLWCRTIDARGVLRPFVKHSRVSANRQGLPSAYCVNGGVYISTPASLRRHRSFHGASTRALVTDAIEGLDIDTPLDLRLARSLWRDARP